MIRSGYTPPRGQCDDDYPCPDHTDAWLGVLGVVLGTAITGVFGWLQEREYRAAKEAARDARESTSED